MAAFDFPATPTDGQTYTPAGSSVTYTYSTASGVWTAKNPAIDLTPYATTAAVSAGYVAKAGGNMTGALGIAPMTTVQRDAIASPIDGMVIYNTTTAQQEIRRSGSWIGLQTSGTVFIGAGGSQPIAAGVRTVYKCTIIKSDASSAYNQATGEFTPKVSGDYIVGALFQDQGTQTGQRFSIWFWADGASEQELYLKNTDVPYSMIGCTAMQSLVAGKKYTIGTSIGYASNISCNFNFYTMIRPS